jgi:hypothetical protein
VVLAVYNIAKTVVPWKMDSKLDIDFLLGNELKLLKSRIVANDTWATFISFSKVLLKNDTFENILLRRIPNGLLKLIPIAPIDPEELFGWQGRYSNFVEDKIDYLYKEISKITNIIDSIKVSFKDSLKNLKIIIVIFIAGWIILKILHWTFQNT